MSVSFRPSIEDVSKFLTDLSAVLKSAATPDHYLFETVSDILSRVLDVLLTLVKQQANTRKVFAVVCAPKLMESLLDLYSSNIGDMKSKIERIIDVALFNQFVLPEFASYFASASLQRRKASAFGGAVPPASKRRKLNNAEDAPSSAVAPSSSFARQLFETLNSMIASTGQSSQRAFLSFGLLYERFLLACSSISARTAKRVAAVSSDAAAEAEPSESATAQSGKLESSLEFAFFLEGISMVDASPLDPRERLDIIDSLLQCAARHDIYKLAALDDASELLQRQSLEKIVSQLFSSGSTSCTFSCLRSIVLMNHLVVEPHLHRVFVLLWSLTPSTEQDSEAAAAFVVALFETYSSLRQFDELLKKMAQCLREWESSEGPSCRWFFLHESIWDCYRTVVETLPPGQLVPIWQFFSDEIYEHYTATILASSATYALTSILAFLPCLSRLYDDLLFQLSLTERLFVEALKSEQTYFFFRTLCIIVYSLFLFLMFQTVVFCRDMFLGSTQTSTVYVA
jgi:hypothetical protein